MQCNVIKGKVEERPEEKGNVITRGEERLQLPELERKKSLIRICFLLSVKYSGRQIRVIIFMTCATVTHLRQGEQKSLIQDEANEFVARIFI